MLRNKIATAILALTICFNGGITVLAESGTSTMPSDKFLQKHYSELLNSTNYKIYDSSTDPDKNIKPILRSLGTAYSEWPVRYEPNYVDVEIEAYPVFVTMFDNSSNNFPTWKGTFSNTKSVNFIVSGGGSIEVEASGKIWGVVEAGIKTTGNFQVTKETNTINYIGQELTANPKISKYSTVVAYYPGIKTGGAMEWAWTDRYGESGTIYKDEKTYLIPYDNSKVETLYVKALALTERQAKDLINDVYSN